MEYGSCICRSCFLPAGGIRFLRYICGIVSEGILILPEIEENFVGMIRWICLIYQIQLQKYIFIK